MIEASVYDSGSENGKEGMSTRVLSDESVKLGATSIYAAMNLFRYFFQHVYYSPPLWPVVEDTSSIKKFYL